MNYSNRRIILFLLMQLCTVPAVHAQDDIHALGAAVDTILRKWGIEHEKKTTRIVDDIFRKQHSAELAARIAKAYYNYNEDDKGNRQFHINDTTRAFYFVREAIKIDSSCAQAYIVASDILAYQREKDAALAWLNAGIKANPSDSSLYKASTEVLFNVAKSEVRKNREIGNTDVDFISFYQPAVEQLKKLKEKDPSYPLDLELARLYYKMYDKGGVMPFQQIAQHYGNVDKKSLNKGDLGAYSMALMYTNQIRALVEVTEYALKQYPDDHGLNQFHFYGKLGVAQAEEDKDKKVALFKEAIEAADKFFAIADTTKLETIHYLRYGECLVGAERYDEGIEQLEKAIKMPGISETNIVAANNTIASAVTGKANNLLKAKDYAGAISIMQPYVDKDRTKSKQNDKLILSYADFYRIWGNNLEGAEQDEKWKKADEQFLEGMKRSVLNKAIFAKRRYDIAVLYDRTATTGAAVPVVNEVVEVLEKEALNDPNVKGALFEPYRYLRAYYTNTNKYALAVEYAEKILDIVPDDQASLQVITAFSKAVKRK